MSFEPSDRWASSSACTHRRAMRTTAMAMAERDLPSRPLYVLPALTLHEAVPGHHLQGAITAEQRDLPAFRRYAYFDVTGEGWGLYAEKLGEDMGIYTTPYERFGRLTYEMWRACCLVVGTGIHAFG